MSDETPDVIKHHPFILTPTHISYLDSNCAGGAPIEKVVCAWFEYQSNAHALLYGLACLLLSPVAGTLLPSEVQDMMGGGSAAVGIALLIFWLLTRGAHVVVGLEGGHKLSAHCSGSSDAHSRFIDAVLQRAADKD